MSSAVIKVENLSKQYRLGLVGSGTLTEDLNRAWAKLRGKEDPMLKIGEANDRSKSGDSDYVWSLKDINFEVEQGDVLGIIGKNGAGKSTLLKILSKVTGPTTGCVKVKGRIASLLEVGTGFHPELTGRENIYLNGAILGMRKSEIDRKFDEIVDFSGVERYIDTPVKRYSSGMYVRLAFAVAAHLESEILIIDEVLAVGDAEFQKKCLGKMGEVSKKDGRTVLFVSHNMASIKSLCNKGILLQNGQISTTGDIDEVTDKYESVYFSEDYCHEHIEDVSKVQHSDIVIQQVNLKVEGDDKPRIIEFNKDILLTVIYEVKKTLAGSLVNLVIESKDQIIAYSFDTDLESNLLDLRNKGLYSALITIPKNILKPGYYQLSFNTGIANVQTTQRLEKVLRFSITLSGENEAFVSYSEKRPGIIALPLKWNTIEKK